jgi:hypothetical protein
MWSAHQIDNALLIQYQTFSRPCLRSIHQWEDQILPEIELNDASSKSRLCRITGLQIKSLGSLATKESAIEARVL